MQIEEVETKEVEKEIKEIKVEKLPSSHISLLGDHVDIGDLSRI